MKRAEGRVWRAITLTCSWAANVPYIGTAETARSLGATVSAGALALFSSPAAIAGGEASNVVVTSTAIATNLGNHVYIQVSSAPTTPAPCSQHSYWHFALSLDTAVGRNLYATLLAAKAAGKQMHFSGLGFCTLDSSVETLRSLTVYE